MEKGIHRILCTILMIILFGGTGGCITVPRHPTDKELKDFESFFSEREKYPVGLILQSCHDSTVSTINGKKIIRFYGKKPNFPNDREEYPNEDLIQLFRESKWKAFWHLFPYWGTYSEYFYTIEKFLPTGTRLRIEEYMIWDIYPYALENGPHFPVRMTDISTGGTYYFEESDWLYDSIKDGFLKVISLETENKRLSTPQKLPSAK